MKWHPATMMLATWSFAVALFLLLPFQLVGRTMTFYGFAILAALLITFCVGALAASQPKPKWQRRAPTLVSPSFELADRIMTAVSLVAIVSSLYDLYSGSGADLNASWMVRDSRAGAMLSGAASESSLAFQIGFLTAPIAYAIIARLVIFDEKIRFPRLVLLGFGPPAAAALASGGRGPLGFALVFFGLAMMVRAYVRKDPSRTVKKRKLTGRQIFFTAVIAVIFLASLNYFVTVFAVRQGGDLSEGMFDVVAERWGVTFGGPYADTMIAVLGEGNTYLIFLFAWYYIQGLFFSNILFTDYAGSQMWGLYGVELLLGAMRRIDPDYVANRYAELNALDVFGFVPSAFGTFYVDLKWLCFPAVFIWGWLAGLVYRKCRTSVDSRWLLAAPFVMQGIFFSTINSPLGLTNGLMTLSWMIMVFLVSKPASLASGRARPSFQAFRKPT
jgi:oligosaccharide repeat unit polymerase